MPTTYKVLAQSSPSAITNTDIYTVPSATSTVVSTMVICNRVSSASTYRIAIRPAGATLANQHFIAYDVTVGSLDSTTLTLGLTLAASTVVTIYSSTANLSFSIFGSEIT